MGMNVKPSQLDHIGVGEHSLPASHLNHIENHTYAPVVSATSPMPTTTAGGISIPPPSLPSLPADLTVGYEATHSHVKQNKGYSKFSRAQSAPGKCRQLLPLT